MAADGIIPPPPSATTDASIRARAASMLERANPTYFREWKDPAK